MSNALSDDEIIRLASNSSLNEEEIMENFKEDDTHEVNKAQKRTFKDDSSLEENEWTLVKRYRKKFKEDNTIEIYISCNEILPKQFGLAKIFRQNEITEVSKVKYLNPFKIRLDISSVGAAKLESCKNLIDKGWRFQRAMERSYSYGVIRNVDLDLSEEKILQCIVCSSPAELVSLNRLNRRNSEENGWSISEAVRLCFKGSFLPAYVYVDEMKIRVEPYTFPVSQCSRCWKFGHNYKRCPAIKLVCPKCGQQHANCETQHFKCVNCTGAHMALAKVCPVFLKEKRLREIMSEFNCTYRKALAIYIPPEPYIHNEPKLINEPTNSYSHIPEEEQKQNTPTFAEITKSYTATMPCKSTNRYNPKKLRKSIATDISFAAEPEYKELNEDQETKKKKDVNFSELLMRLKEILFLNDVSIQKKFYEALRSCVEWVILLVVENIADWPILKSILDYLKIYNGPP